MSDDTPAERALDLLVYAPVGAALYLRDTLPTFVNLFVSRGRAELVQRRQQAQESVEQAKALGEFAVGVGGPKVREHVEKGIDMARKSAEAVIGGMAGESVAPSTSASAPPPPDSTPAPAPAPVEQPSHASGNADTATKPPAEESTRAAWAPSAAKLGIPDYDELSASQVVERLEGLPPGELDAVRAYEEAHRARRTILYKIEKLTN